MKAPFLLLALLFASAQLFAQQIDIARPRPGASAFALDWSLVQPEIAHTNRVCSYDRAGSGWSDPRPNVETPA